jgi:phenylalanine ammonia-lyase
MVGDRTQPVILSGEGLNIDNLVVVARRNCAVRLTDDPTVWNRIDAAVEYLRLSVERRSPIYGVTTSFGAMSNVEVGDFNKTDVQHNLIHSLKTGAGKFLPREDVRAAMLLRVNCHLKGASGVRRELIDRLVAFLNNGVTPDVRQYGSIGASGDLVPLATICGAVIGLSEAFTVDFGGERLSSLAALQRLGLKPLQLDHKEGLAMVNGTSMMTGMAANALYDGHNLLALALGVHALFFQAMRASVETFHPFIHSMKPHPGQVWTAHRMNALLEGSSFVRDGFPETSDRENGRLLQDRYSLRCLPQYMGPIVDGFEGIRKQIEIEMNSADDNPLIDAANQGSYHGGNFLGQYVGIAMDHFRYYLGLMVKHLDTQIALLVAPEFNNGLPASLVGNPARQINMGLKGLQIAANSIMPLIGHLGTPLVDRFPTHAEQFNQNVNSQGFGAARLARKSVEQCQQYMAIALLFAAQAVDLRAKEQLSSFDPRRGLSPATVPLYEAVKEVVGRQPSADRPLIWDDHEQAMDGYVEALAKDIAAEGKTVAAARDFNEGLPRGQ